MKIVKVKAINWQTEGGKYADEYRGNIVVEQADRLSVPYIYLFLKNGTTYTLLDSTIGVEIVGQIEDLGKNEKMLYDRVKDLEKENEKLHIWNGQNAEKLVKKDAEIAELEQTEQQLTERVKGLERETGEWMAEIGQLEKTIIELRKNPVPTISDIEARARALVILGGQFTAAEISLLANTGAIKL